MEIFKLFFEHFWLFSDFFKKVISELKCGEKRNKIAKHQQEQVRQVKAFIGLSGVFAGCLGGVVLCKPCHSSLHGRQQAQPRSVVRL